MVKCSKADAACLSVSDAMAFSEKGSLTLTTASRTCSCHLFNESIARAKLGAEHARTASDAISGGTGVTKSGRAEKREIRAASSTLRK